MNDRDVQPRSADSLQDLVGLGPRSAQWLADAGITTEKQLRQLGAAEAFRPVRDGRAQRVSLNLLWALEAGLRGLHWTMLSPQQKEQLRQQLQAADAKAKNSSCSE